MIRRIARIKKSVSALGYGFGSVSILFPDADADTDLQNQKLRMWIRIRIFKTGNFGCGYGYGSSKLETSENFLTESLQKNTILVEKKSGYGSHAKKSSDADTDTDPRGKNVGFGYGSSSSSLSDADTDSDQKIPIFADLISARGSPDPSVPVISLPLTLQNTEKNALKKPK